MRVVLYCRRQYPCFVDVDACRPLRINLLLCVRINFDRGEVTFTTQTVAMCMRMRNIRIVDKKKKIQ